MDSPRCFYRRWQVVSGHDNCRLPFLSKDENPSVNHLPTATLQSTMLTAKISAPLRLLRLAGFYPSSNLLGFERKISLQDRFIEAFLFVITLIFIGINIGMVGFTCFVVNMFREDYGMINVYTISSIITGLKPCHNLVNLVVFGLRLPVHQRLLQHLNMIDIHFQRHHQYCVRPLNWCRQLLIVTTFVLITSLLIRTTQYWMCVEYHQEFWLIHVSLVLVPLMGVWQLVPLLYFHLITQLIRDWLQHLRSYLKMDNKLTNNRLAVYHESFFLCTRAIELLGKLVNPFISFSIAISLVVLCLTIYFAVNAPTILNFTPDTEDEEKLSVYFMVVWSSVQISVAMAYIFTICVDGFKTNERARKILGATLNLKVTGNQPQERFLINAIGTKVMTQNASWGLSIWRAIPLERNLIISFISLIGTYAIFLIKLKSNVPLCQVREDICSSCNNSVLLDSDH